MTPDDNAYNYRFIRWLYNTVLLQAFKDATNHRRTGIDNEDRAQREFCRLWLVTESEDLETVCDIAGYDMWYVIKCAKNLKKNAWIHEHSTNRYIGSKERIYFMPLFMRDL